MMGRNIFPPRRAVQAAARRHRALPAAGRGARAQHQRLQRAQLRFLVREGKKKTQPSQDSFASFPQAHLLWVVCWRFFFFPLIHIEYI